MNLHFVTAGITECAGGHTDLIAGQVYAGFLSGFRNIGRTYRTEQFTFITGLDADGEALPEMASLRA